MKKHTIKVNKVDGAILLAIIKDAQAHFNSVNNESYQKTCEKVIEQLLSVEEIAYNQILF